MALSRWPGAEIINFDLLTYAGNPANVKDCESNRKYGFIHGDIRDKQAVVAAVEGVDTIVHFAAESHVDRSILASDDFMTTNVLGTHVLLEAARQAGVKKFLFVGTDEVYGSLEEPQYAIESTPLAPNSPYSVSKASADLLVRSYHVTYDLPVLISRTCNNFGPYQYPEKLIPLFTTNLLEDKKVPLYGDGLNVRDWIYVEDNCEAIAMILEKGEIGEIYNIAGDCPHTNLEIASKILSTLGKDDNWIEYVKDRPGHDRRYAVDRSKITHDLGWSPKWDFADALQTTIEWYASNREWWDPIKSGAYREYYNTQYKERLATA
jgi:dTDP-glucose 4,6-dehydratase